MSDHAIQMLEVIKRISRQEKRRRRLRKLGTWCMIAVLWFVACAMTGWFLAAPLYRLWLVN
mgnify:CR=1 FL=1